MEHTDPIPSRVSAFSQDAPPVRVRYWAGARACAGTDEDEVRAGTVGAALDAVRDRRPGLAEVIAVSTILLDGRSAGPGAALPAGAVVEVLPPFAGG